MELAPHRLTVLFDTPKAFPVAFVPPKWAKTSDFSCSSPSLLLSLTIKTQQGQASKPYVFKNTNMKIQDMTMSERIKMQMQKLNLKSKDLIEATKASKGTVSQWVNGGNEPSAQYIAPLAKVLRVSEQWLLLGGAQRQNRRSRIPENSKNSSIIITAGGEWSDLMNQDLTHFQNWITVSDDVSPSHLQYRWTMTLW